jgi:hypothetical protein
MNRNAIVLAADSALTYADDYGGNIHARGADKIFTISHAGPVAVMFYNVASYFGIPWAVIFDEFRKESSHLGDAYSIDDWYSHIVEYLKEVPSTRKFGVSEADEVANFGLFINAFVQDFASLIRREGWSPGEAPTNAEFNSALGKYSRQIETIPTLGPNGQLIAMVRRRSVPSERLAGFFKAYAVSHLIEALEQDFGDSGFPEEGILPLLKLLFTSLLVDWVPDSMEEALTGLVLAGYGRGEVLPRAISFEFVPGFAGVLKFLKRDQHSPENGYDGGVVIETFGQDDLLVGWTNGISSEVERSLIKAQGEFLETIKSQILDGEVSLKASDIAKIDAIFENAINASPELLFWSKLLGSGPANLKNLVRLVSMSNDGMLVEIATKLMTLTTLGKELVNEHSVSRPLNILAMKRGEITPHVIP